MARKKTQAYTAKFRRKALRLADQVGGRGCTRQLGLNGSQLYQCRAKANYKASVTQRESDLAAEIARLRHELGDKKRRSTSQNMRRSTSRRTKSRTLSVVVQTPGEYSIDVLANAPDVTRSGFYAWRNAVRTRR